MAAAEAARLKRRRASEPDIGGISLINTVTVPKKAAGREYLPHRRAQREVYGHLRKLDDGLMPIDRTGLMDLDCWR